MFEISELRRLNGDLHAISSNFATLHFDEYPILFCGTNLYGNKIIGSLMSEDYETDTFRYLHIIANDLQFWKFLNRKISYRQAIEESGAIFIIDKDINEREIAAYQINFLDVPEDYLPLPTAMCPESIWNLGFDYSISLKGKIADLNEAVIKSVSSITESFADLVFKAASSIRLLKIKPEIFQSVHTEGSFRINLRVKIGEFRDLFIGFDDVSNYMAQYINYCIEDLPNEIKELVLEDNQEIPEGINFIKLTDHLSAIYQKGAMQFDVEQKENLRIDVLTSLTKLEDISDEIGNGFNAIEVLGKELENQTDVALAFIDKSKSIDITSASDYFLHHSNETEEDDRDKEYQVCIYHLNLSSRTGNAYIYNENDEKVMDKPKIIILGDNELSGTQFTESLHLNKWISIMGRAKRQKGKIKYITILGELT